MIAYSKIETLIEEFLFGTDLFLVELQVKGVLMVVRIDGDNGVGIKDCVKLSKHLESNLDRDVTDFKLDVTSAGVGKPFKLHRQYLNHRGKLVEVTSANGVKTTGVLMEVKDDHILLKENNRKETIRKQEKDYQEELREFSLDEISETRATVQFN